MAGVGDARSAGEKDYAVLLRALLTTGPGFWISLLVLGAGSSWLFSQFWRQIETGHGVTGLGSRGVVWGVIVANIVNFIGISHVGIAISAVVRILRLERYRQLARLAELVTLASITTAVLNITMDVGRPEQFILTVVWSGRWTSPLVWSATVITTYVVGSSVYLYLAMRHDLSTCAEKVPARRSLYWLLSLGYRDTAAARQRHHRVVWWLAVIILPIMVSVHSVYGYIFGLQAGRPGWYNSFQAPYFVLGAIVSGFSAIIVVAAILRKALRWEEIFPPRIFKGLGVFLGFVTLLYVYFLISEWLTGVYASPEHERAFFWDVLSGRFMPITRTAFVFGMLLPFALLFIQGVNPKICSVSLTVFCAVLINVSLWVMRALIVVPSFYHPLLPWKMAPYTPSFAEWGQVIGSFFLFGLLLLAFIKIVPVLELPQEPVAHETASFPAMPWWKRFVIGASVIAGISLIALGIALRNQSEFYHSPTIWISGILVLWSVPVQICALPEGRRPAEFAGAVQHAARFTA
jgi:molybdopterin-containing oxidoreductase family membrane subunit